MYKRQASTLGNQWGAKGVGTMPRAVILSAVVLLLAGCIAPPAGPVGRADQTPGLSLQETFARDLRFIYEEIRDNYVNLAYKEEMLGFDWDELYARYSAGLAQVRTEKEFFRLASRFLSELRDGHVALGPYRGLDVYKRQGTDPAWPGVLLLSQREYAPKSAPPSRFSPTAGDHIFCCRWAPTGGKGKKRCV